MPQRLPAGYLNSPDISQSNYGQLDLRWPPNVYSLSHVAVPFAPNDPMYEIDATPAYVDNMMLGVLQPRGERQVLLVPVEQLTRLRYNPFFSYLRQPVIEFCAVCDHGP